MLPNEPAPEASAPGQGNAHVLGADHIGARAAGAAGDREARSVYREDQNMAVAPCTVDCRDCRRPAHRDRRVDWQCDRAGRGDRAADIVHTDVAIDHRRLVVR